MAVTCTYCGAADALTRDHVPLRSLFRKPRPALITVPCCRPCNGIASLDDEYFRTVIALRQGVRDHPDGAEARDASVRALSRTQSGGLRQLLLSPASRSQRVTPSGRVLGPGISIPVDGRRLSRVGERIIRGLFFHVRGEPLPPTHEASAYAEEALAEISRDSRADLHQLIIQPALAGTPIELGDGAFRCWHHFVREDPLVSGWVLEFYGDFRMFGVTIPKILADDA